MVLGIISVEVGKVVRFMDFPSVCVRDTLQLSRALSNVIQLSDAKKIVSTFLTVKTTQRAAQKLIKLVDMNRVGGAVIWNTFTVAQLKDH